MTPHETDGHSSAHDCGSEKRWTYVLPLLREFQTFLAATCPPFRIAQATDQQWTDEEYKRLRPKGFPGHLRGVYLLYGSDEQLLYVGLAMFNYDKRVWSHGSDIPRRWIDIIPFDDHHAFLAPALEFYLISKLKPQFNKAYRDY